MEVLAVLAVLAAVEAYGVPRTCGRPPSGRMCVDCALVAAEAEDDGAPIPRVALRGRKSVGGRGGWGGEWGLDCGLEGDIELEGECKPPGAAPAAPNPAGAVAPKSGVAGGVGCGVRLGVGVRMTTRGMWIVCVVVSVVDPATTAADGTDSGSCSDSGFVIVVVVAADPDCADEWYAVKGGNNNVADGDPIGPAIAIDVGGPVISPGRPTRSPSPFAIIAARLALAAAAIDADEEDAEEAGVGYVLLRVRMSGGSMSQMMRPTMPAPARGAAGAGGVGAALSIDKQINVRNTGD